jgi:oligopeptide/dipeptide ABC transporter ATP-binding protein
MRVGRIVSEPLRAYRRFTGTEIGSRVAEVLRQVELEPSAARRYPAAFSGGQRQRIAIARALISKPKLIILDEAVSSQDVSIRAQILNLLRDIQQQSGVAFLFISHDLSNVRFLCERLYVMYLGSVVETGPVDSIYRLPRHPYTKMLLESWLPADPQVARRRRLDPKPSVIMNQRLSGWRFHQRCPLAVDRCRIESPKLEPVGNAGRLVACHRSREIPGTFPTPNWTSKQ